MNSFPNITQKKTAKINRLKNSVKNATKRVETTQASLEAATVKAELFDGLLNEARGRLKVATTQLYTASKGIQNLKSLENTDEEAQVAVKNTQQDANRLLAEVQAVTVATLSAASAITEMARLITERKASNPLISSELVNRAQATVTAADRASTLIINTLVTVTNALATSEQAREIARIVHQEIGGLADQLVFEDTQDQRAGKTNANAIQHLVKVKYDAARDVEHAAHNSAKDALDQKLAAQNQVNMANNQLNKAEAALAAAEAAVNGNT